MRHWTALKIVAFLIARKASANAGAVDIHKLPRTKNVNSDGLTQLIGRGIFKAKFPQMTHGGRLRFVEVAALGATQVFLPHFAVGHLNCRVAVGLGVLICVIGHGPACTTVMGTDRPASSKIWVMPNFVPKIPTVTIAFLKNTTHNKTARGSRKATPRQIPTVRNGGLTQQLHGQDDDA